MFRDLEREVRSHTEKASLQAQAEQRATEDHARRLAEIKAIAPHLARLDAFIPALAAAGLTVYTDSLHLRIEWQGPRRLKVLRLATSGTLDDTLASKWHAALLALGFTEVKRTADAYPQALLRHGSLLLWVDLPRDRRAFGQGAIEYANRAAVGVPA